MKTATLVGYHGHKNLGDDIFRKILMKWLSSVMGVNTCSVSARSNSIEKMIFGIKLCTFESPIKSVSRFLWLPIFLKSLRSDYLIFSAGSIFTIQPFFIMYCTLRLLKLIRGNALNIMAVGVSIGPFKNNFDKYWCLKSLRLMNQIMLRDQKSSEILSSSSFNIPYKLSYDLALSWYKTFPESIQTCSKDTILIGLALTSRGFGECAGKVHSNICDSIIMAIESAIKQCDKINIRIFSICNDSIDGDLETCKHISRRLFDMGINSELVIYDGENIDEYLSSISKCVLMIASRMHAGIMAARASIPVYQISYAEKINAFYKHSELSTTYMYANDKVTKESIEEFISQSLSGRLTSFSDTQNHQLKAKGEIVYSDLLNLN